MCSAAIMACVIVQGPLIWQLLQLIVLQCNFCKLSSLVMLVGHDCPFIKHTGCPEGALPYIALLDKSNAVSKASINGVVTI